MKNIMKFEKIIVLLMLFVMFSLAIGTVSASIGGTVNIDTKDNDIIKIEVKEKKVPTNKISWNCNGGKIGSKKTVITKIKKGNKINKLVSPKRTGYIFQGWYTKKNGGIKISKNTKSTKNVIYYAQWKKIRVLNSEEKKLVGNYTYGSISTGYWSYYTYNKDKWNEGSTFFKAYEFKSDGTYQSATIAFGSTFTGGGGHIIIKGKWHIPVKGTLRLTDRWADEYSKSGTQLNQKYNDDTTDYLHAERNGKKGIVFDKEVGESDLDTWLFVKN